MPPGTADKHSEENFLHTYHIDDSTNNLINSSFKMVPGSSGHQAGAESGFGGSENIVADQRSGSQGSDPDSPAGDKSSKTATDKPNRRH